MQALGRWGAESMGEPEPDQAVRSEWLVVALTAFFDAEAAAETEATVLLDFPDGPYRLVIDGGTLRVERRDEAADLTISAHIGALIAYLSGAPVPIEAEGDHALLARLPELFPFRLQPVNVR
jgi:hypothetical protein